MAKPIPMRLQVEEIAFGKVFRLLNSMPGVVSIDIDADKIGKKHGASEHTKTLRAPRGEFRTSAIGLMLAAASRGPIERSKLVDAIVAGGKSPTTLNGQLFIAKQKKLLAQTTKGFAITARGKAMLNGKGEAA